MTASDSTEPVSDSARARNERARQANDGQGTSEGDERAVSAGWHLDADTARRYASGAAGQPFAASAEAHLAACAHCRALLVPLVEAPRLDAIWAEVAERVDAPRPGLIERVLHRVGVGRDTARLLAATPALRVSWLFAVALSLVFAALAADAGPRGTLLFLTLAPVLPVAGVAAAYGRDVDPIHELAAAAPYSGFRLLLLRAAAVVATTMVLSAVGGLLLPVGVTTAAAWLLPALALTTLTLALSARVPLPRAAVAVVACWFAVVVGAQREAGGRAALAEGDYAAFGAVGQLIALVVLLISAAFLTLGHRRYTVVLGRTS